jgi:tetracycline resistance efflux pump
MMLAISRWSSTIGLHTLTSWGTFWDGQSNLLLFLFLTILNMVIALIQRSGDAFAYAATIRNYLSSKRSAEQSSLVLSLILCVDDYLSSITVSSVAPVLTDTFSIPRLKEAFLVTTMAAPLATLFPLSSWSGSLTSFIASGGIDATSSTSQIAIAPFAAYFYAIPFTLYSILVVIAAWFITATRISYGIISRHEKIATTTGNLYGGGSPTKELHTHNGITHSLFNFLTPLITLFVTIFFAICYVGNSWLLGGSNGLIDTFIAASNQFYIVLVTGGLVSLLIASLLYIRSTHVSIPASWWAGIKDVGPTLIILSLAWTFASFLKTELQTGTYIAQLLLSVLSIKFLPVTIFFLAACIALIIGSSWAAMIVVFPIAIPMIPTLLGISTPAAATAAPILYPVIGAIISGALFGSSLSPLADLLNITSNNTRINHFDYLKAQIQYLAPVGLATAVALITAGILSNYSYPITTLCSLGVGIIIMCSSYLVVNKG